MVYVVFSCYVIYNYFSYKLNFFAGRFYRGCIMKGKDLFMLSVDTELKVERVKKDELAEVCILGNVNGRQIGIPLIMSNLEERGMRGVFFLDIPCFYLIGEKKFRSVVDSILDRGHDVQVHLHPGGLCKSENKHLIQAGHDWRENGSIDAFRIALEDSVSIFEKCVKKAPIAFRNGAYHFRKDYMQVLKDFNFMYDSSFNTFVNWHEEDGIWESGRTTPYEVLDGLIEFPVSWASFPLPGNIPGRKNKMITGINCGGMEESIGVFRRSFEHNEDRPTMFFMGLLHSFTFIEIEKVEIDGVMQNRFSNNEDLTRIKVLSLLLDKVKDLPNIEAVTFTDLQHMNYKPPMSSYSADPYPEYFRDTKTHGYGWLRKYSASYLEKLEVTNVS